MSFDTKRYYAVLGVDPVCTDDEIRQAFRRRAKELHPDATTGSASAFIQLKRAYDTLIDPASRARYDRTRPSRFRRRAPRPPKPPRPARPRPGGISLRRYVLAFLFMAGLSYLAIDWMISWAYEPSGVALHVPVPPVPQQPAKPVAGPSPAGPGPGFWNPANPTSRPERPASKEWAPD